MSKKHADILRELFKEESLKNAKMAAAINNVAELICRLENSDEAVESYIMSVLKAKFHN